MKNFGIVLVVLFFYSYSYSKTQVVKITKPIGTYALDFTKIYETYATLDLETKICLPKGYEFTAAKQGSDYFIYATHEHNQIMFGKLVPHPILTNIQTNVLTPRGEHKTLVFQIRGSKKTPKVQLIKFEIVKPKHTPEKTALKQLYIQQMEAKLKAQNLFLERKIRKETILKTKSVPFNERSLQIEHKGVYFRVTDILENSGELYIHCFTSSPDAMTKLKGVKLNKKSGTVNARLIKSKKLDNNFIEFIYKVHVDTYKREKIYFVVSIWSKEFILSSKI